MRTLLAVPAPLSPARRNAIVEAYLKGSEKAEIAFGGEQISTVSRMIGKFEQDVQSSGIKRAAEMYEVSDLVDELHETSRVLKTNSITASEVKPASQVIRILRKLDLAPDTVEPFMSGVVAFASTRGYDPSQLLTHCLRLAELERDHGDIEATLNKHQTIGQQVTEMGTGLKNMRKEEERVGKRLSSLLERHEFSEAELGHFSKIRRELISLGLGIDRLEKLRTLLVALKKSNFKPDALVSKLKRAKSLEEEIASLGGNKRDFLSLLKDLKREYQEISKTLQKKKSILDEIKNLENMGLSASVVKNLRNYIVQISTAHRITRKAAMQAFTKNLQKHYDPFLGLEPIVVQLQSTRSKLLSEIKGLKEKETVERKKMVSRLKELESSFKKKKGVLDAYAKLRSRGVDDNFIVRLEQLIVESKIDAQLLEGELTNLAKLSKHEREILTNLDELSTREKALLESVQALKEEKGSIQKSIDAVRREGVRSIRSVGEAASESIGHTTQRFESSMTSTLEETKVKLSQIEQSSTLARDRIDVLVKEIGEVIDQAFKAGIDLKSIQPIADAYQFIGTGQGDAEKVIPLADMFLGNLKMWLQSRGKLDAFGESHIRYLRESLEK